MSLAHKRTSGKQKRRFTLVEILVAMIVLTIFMAALMQFFSATQKLMSGSSDQTELYSRAKVVMDMIENDLQCIYDRDGKSVRESNNTGIFYPFYLVKAASANYCEAMYILTERSEPVTTSDKINVAAVKYYPETNYKNLNHFKLLTMAVGNYDKDPTGISFPLLTDCPECVAATAYYSDSLFTVSGREPITIAEGVIEFSVLADKLAEFSPQSNKTSAKIPTLVQISITLIPKSVIAKLEYVGDTEKTALINESKRTFTRRILIDRGNL